MKTARELVPVSEWCTRGECDGIQWCQHDVEAVAQRAREEMIKECVAVTIDAAADGYYDSSARDATDRIIVAIRALSVKP